jgi:hypothetical protein
MVVSIWAALVRRLHETQQGEATMRFMVFVKADKRSEAGQMPSDAELAEMGKFNDELIKAGIMLGGDGLHPSSRGAKVRFPDKTVIDGPFSEAKEIVAGYWIWQCKSLEEAIEWAKRAPCSPGVGGELEIRPIFELSDFEMSTETRERFERQDAALRH